MIRIGIVDDSSTFRRWLSSFLEGQPDVEIVGVARDGKGAIELVLRERPDVLVMDLAMPGTNGAEATRRIMEECPTPILIVSSAANRSHGLDIVAGLIAGAFDAIEKPPSGGDVEWQASFMRSVRAAARVRPIRVRRASPTGGDPVPEPSDPIEVVVMGASTGGPRILSTLLQELKPLRQPILLVVHFPPDLATHLLECLARVSALPVEPARSGLSLSHCGGKVIVARGGCHLRIGRDGRLQETDEPERHFSRPSVDVLFESAARWRPERTLGVLFTGMGKDGAEGLLEIRKNGGITFVQDEASCAVFGMPKAAIEIGAAQRVVPGPRMAEAIAAVCER